MNFDYILNRAKEASTYAGLAVFIGMFGVDSDTIQRLTANAPAIAAGIGAVIAIFAPSRFGGHTGLKNASASTNPRNT